MVGADSLIAVFEKMYQEHWRYEWGHHEKGCVDCSGAFTYAFSQFGYNCPNGSNSMARNFIVGDLLPISAAEPGMAAFKAYTPGEKGYNLPSKYASDKDQNDYYHVGLVARDEKNVLNAKGTNYGFSLDKLANNGWDYVAKLKYTQYPTKPEEDPQMKEKAVVVLPTGATGNTVNMRKNPNRASEVIVKVPVGDPIWVLEDKAQWCNVQYVDKIGWMMSNYIEYAGQSTDETGTITDEQRSRIESALSAIETQIDIIGAIVGRG